jgi:phage repressor protein C with HTH and peptisase S24 domain
METIVQRIKKYVEIKGLRVSNVEQEIGVSNGTLSKSFHSNTSIKTETLEKFLEKYEDINPSWVLTGNGDILKSKITLYKAKSKEILREQQEVPLYDIEATAGIVTLFKDIRSNEAIEKIHIPNLPKCDGAVYVTGDSMYPLLKSGDIVMYKKIEDVNNNIFWGEMYLLSLDFDGEEMVMVKFIQKSTKGENYIRLVSQNQHHQDKDVELSKILALAIIKASIRINSMS